MEDWRVKYNLAMIKIYGLKESIKDLCTDGLSIDGAHHKQWHLEEILKLLGYDLKEISLELCKEEAEDKGEDSKERFKKYNNEGFWWEPGIH